MVTTNPLLEELGANPLARIQDLANEIRATRETFFDFAIGDPDEPTPASVRSALTQAVLEPAREPAVVGEPRFRAAVADYVERRHGHRLDPETQIIPSAGSKEAIFHLPFSVIDRAKGGSVVWGSPGYPVYERGALLAGASSDEIRLSAETGWLLRLDSLDEARLDRARIAWINYPHNPTGAVADHDYYRAQLETARRHDILLCSDEVYQDLWSKEPHPSIFEACAPGDGAAGVVAFLSLSKRSGMTGYRAGAIVGDAAIIARYARLRASTGTVPSLPIQHAASVAFDDDGHVEERRLLFDEKRRVLIAFLESHGYQVSGSSGGLYVWFRAPRGDDSAYVTQLLEFGIIATPGSAFGPSGAGWIRLALVPALGECHRAVAAWADALSIGLAQPS